MAALAVSSNRFSALAFQELERNSPITEAQNTTCQKLSTGELVSPKFSNICLAKLQQLGEYLSNLSLNTPVRCKIDRSYWRLDPLISSERAQRLMTNMDLFFKVDRQEEINTKSCGKQGLGDRSIELVSWFLEQRIFVNLPAFEIIRSFAEQMGAAAGDLGINLDGIQWKHNIRPFLKESISEAVHFLHRRGFYVSLSLPYLHMTENTLRQDLIVTIPVNQLGPISPDDSLEWHAPELLGLSNDNYRDITRNYPKTVDKLSLYHLSAKNVLIARARAAREKERPKPLAPPDWKVDKVLEGLLDQLKQIASQAPLIRRCAFPICLNPERQKKLLGEIHSFGFAAEIEPVTMGTMYDSIEDPNKPFFEQLLVVTLPEEPKEIGNEAWVVV